MICPCKGCADRRAKCHAECQKYKAYRAALDAEAARKDKLKGVADACEQLHDHRYQSIHKNANLRRFKKT